MVNISAAKTKEAEILTNLAIRSEAYWGFDSDYMEQFKVMYRVSEDFINANSTFVIKDDHEIIGFYSIVLGEEKTSLEYFFIDSKFIGKGYGKLLWNHMSSNCQRLGIKGIEIVTSPEATEFYIKAGAIEVGEIESLVKKGRKIPRLMYTLK